MSPAIPVTTHSFVRHCFVRHCIVASLFAATLSCGGGSGSSTETGIDSDGQSLDTMLNDDDTNPIATGETTSDRELVVSENTARIIDVTQCLCTALYRSTLRYYHFEDQQAVLEIEFDNKTSAFTPQATVYLFDQNSTSTLVSRWINNQHSDGLYVEIASPLNSVPLTADAVTITSQAFIKNEAGYSGDSYASHRLEFTVANQSETGVFFLNGFSDQTTVHLQTTAPTM